ncbi:MAG: hypothetical protein AVDCRST_MAG04-3175, partial [uncultured Acetobacteraceae bacterium]
GRQAGPARQPLPRRAAAGAEDRRRGGADDGGRARHGGGRQRGRPRGLPAQPRHRL